MNKIVKLLAVPTLLSVNMMACASTNYGSDVDFQGIENAVTKCDSKIMGNKGMVVNGKTYYQYRYAIEAAERAGATKTIKMLDDAMDKCMNNAGYK